MQCEDICGRDRGHPSRHSCEDHLLNGVDQDEGMLASHEAGLERDLFPHGISDVDVEHAPMRVLQ